MRHCCQGIYFSGSSGHHDLRSVKYSTTLKVIDLSLLCLFVCLFVCLFIGNLHISNI